MTKYSQYLPEHSAAEKAADSPKAMIYLVLQHMLFRAKRYHPNGTIQEYASNTPDGLLVGGNVGDRFPNESRESVLSCLRQLEREGTIESYAYHGRLRWMAVTITAPVTWGDLQTGDPLSNGAEVVSVEDTNNGWVSINYVGADGQRGCVDRLSNQKAPL